MTRARTCVASPSSPATKRRSSRPSRALRSSRATSSASSGVRTEWSRPTPLSQIGYHSESASSAMPFVRPSWSSTRSRSEYGAGSRRPRPPTATSEMPCSPSGNAARSQLSYASDNASRRGADTSPGRRSTPARTSFSDSEGVAATLTGPHADECIDRGDPDLAVTDLAGTRRLVDGVDHLVGVEIGDEDVQTNLRHQVHRVLRAAVDLGVALLSPKALDLADGQSLDAQHFERGLDIIELERLDDSCYLLHAETLSLLATAGLKFPEDPTPARS